jgi:hypothetical protein
MMKVLVKVVKLVLVSTSSLLEIIGYGQRWEEEYMREGRAQEARESLEAAAKETRKTQPVTVTSLRQRPHNTRLVGYRNGE